MSTEPYQLTLPTPYGDATFGIELSAGGEVEQIALPLENLPASVYKLTYGNGWEEVRNYFAALGATLPYRIHASLGNDCFPDELKELITRYEELVPADDFATFWREQSAWMGLFEFRESKVNRRLKKFIGSGPKPAFGPYLLPYLQTLLPVSSERTEALIWRAIGAVATVAAKEVLLGALESEGRHPFTADILRGLEHFSDQDTLRRLIAVYRAGKFSITELEAYLLSLHRFASTEVVEHLREVLRGHPEQVESIVVALRAAGQPDAEIAADLYAQFEREQDYYVLDALVRSINGLSVSNYRIDLPRLNQKMDTPIYIELPPVNWPQQLESGWRQLIEQTEGSLVMDVVEQYLNRREPRLQRNAVMQLKYFRSLAGRQDNIPLAIERRLRELLSSPFDKVYVEILNILGDRPVELSERKEMFEALLEVSLRSPYRTVVLKAMYRVGKAAEWRAYAREFYLGKLKADGSPRVVEQIAAALPYLKKYLGGTETVQAALDRRQSKTEPQ